MLLLNLIAAGVLMGGLGLLILGLASFLRALHGR